jgi:murein L,D-transpeptidase YafK
MKRFCRALPWLQRLLLLAGILIAPVAGLAAERSESEQFAHASRALKESNSDAVRQLSSQERAILQATLALKSDQPGRALQILTATRAEDPLAALLEAEALRLEAVQAMSQVGDYAAGLQQQEQLLASANLKRGLGEADARLHAFMDKLNAVSGDPFDILLPGVGVANVFMVDKARSRLYVFARGPDGLLRRIADEYVVTGTAVGDKQREGDGRTPNGVYRFVRKLQGDALQARFGPVAFPIDYPNSLDRLHRKNGGGIWLHGYPTDVQRRPPQDTRGCFSLPNATLLKIAKHIKLGQSWVIIGENFEFRRNASKQTMLKSVLDDIEAWRRDWISLDAEAYLSHYHPSFRSGNRDFTAWKRQMRNVNAGKTFVDVGFRNLTLIHDPNRWPEGDVVVAEFTQQYRSNNFSEKARKRLYLARASADDHWKILVEKRLKQ